MSKLIKKLLLFALTIFLILVISVQFPSLFIDKKFTYKSFEIYSNANIKLDESIKNVLDSVLIILDESEFSEESDEYKLYFIRGTLYEELLRILGRKNMAFSKFEKHIYSAYPNFKEGKLIRNNNELECLNLIQIISHEGVHSQMYKDYYGWFEMKTPFWINEGYAEYISYKPFRELENYDITSLLSKLENSKGVWLKTEYNTMTLREYVKSRLLIEYLMDVKKMRIKEIIENKQLNPNEIFEEIKELYK